MPDHGVDPAANTIAVVDVVAELHNDVRYAPKQIVSCPGRGAA
jgi:hypothetical protein